MAIRFVTLCFTGLGMWCLGCSTAKIAHDADYVELSYTAERALSAPPEEIVNPVVSQLAGPHAVEEYIQVAIAQNPEIQAARKRVEAAAYQVPVAASLDDPMLNFSAQPAPVQTAAGEQRTTLAANQKFPWFGKLDRRGSQAEAQTDVFRAELAATELAVMEQVQRSYYELYFIQQAIAVTEEEQKLLEEIRDVANARYKANKTSQQDVLRAELEISNVENDLIRLKQQLESTQAALARLLHIAPQTKVRAMEKLPVSQVVQDLESLQKQAVAARPELHARLAAMDRDRQGVELALLNYKPDVTVGFSWIAVDDEGLSRVADGQDTFMLTAGINLPVYRNRLDSQVRSAEAKAVATARDYDAFRDVTLAQVVDLFAKINSQRDLLTLFEEDILPRARQTLEVSGRAYNVGEVDFLQLLDNWRQLLRYEIAYRRIDATLRQTLAELERVVGGFLEPRPLPGEGTPQPIPPAPKPNDEGNEDQEKNKEEGEDNKEQEGNKQAAGQQPRSMGDQKPMAANMPGLAPAWRPPSRLVSPANYAKEK